MARRVTDLRKLGKLSREKVAAVCAIAAVACLSSVIVRWSDQAPERPVLGKNSLVGDAKEQSVAAPIPAEASSTRANVTGREEDPSPIPSLLTEGASQARVWNRIPLTSRDTSRPSPGRIETDSDIANSIADNIRLIAFEHTMKGEVAWLSGEIETDPLDELQSLKVPDRINRPGNFFADE